MSDDWTTVSPQAEKEEEKVEFEIENEAASEEQLQLDLGDAEYVQQKTQEQGVAEETEEKESGAQKRIRQLVRQRKEREAQIAELQSRQEALEAKLKERETDFANSIKSNLDNNERSIADKLEMSKSAYRQAVESGDADRMLAAQEAMTIAQTEAMQLRQSQHAYQKYQEELANSREATPAQPATAAENYDPKAIAWAAKNPWFGQDNILTQAALQIDASMKDEGYDPSDEEYYEEIDKRLSSAFPSRFDASEKVETRNEAPNKASQVVAGASRTPNPSSGRKVKLSQEDVRLAEKWGIPLEQYAAEKLKVEKADGEYTSINNQRGGY